MNMLNKKICEFLEQAGPIFFVTPTVGRAIGLEKILPDFHIICSQNSEDIELLRKAGVKVFFLEKDIKNSGKLLADAQVLDYIKSNSLGKRANIVTFKPSPMIEMICEKNDFRYLGNDSKINRDWEDKINFANITTRLGVPNANSRIIKIEKELRADFLDFSKEEKYVVQFSRGYSGNSSFLVESQKDFEKILENNIGRKIKIADYRNGDTYTFDVCIGDFGTLVSQPIFQISGFTEFNKNILGTCGNDYSYGKNLSKEIKKELDLNIRKISEELFRVGYRGILGFDFLVGEKKVDLIEVNPRLVGSVPVFTKLQISSGEMPFLLLHILCFLGFTFQDMELEDVRRDFDFSQLILRNTFEQIKIVEKAMPSGVYKIEGEKIVFERSDYFADDKLAENEFFVTCASAGELVDSDMEYTNIQLACGIMKEKNLFNKHFIKIKEEVLRKIILK